MIKTVFDLDVFKLTYKLAMDVFHMTRNFPKEERYSLTDQIVRSSRSIAALIAEGWGRRTYENDFKKYLVYAMGSIEETKVWLFFSRDCGYISNDQFMAIEKVLDESGAKIYKLFQNWKKH
ncbi:MAG TPA: four helix bundle protein [Chitinophagaceae bacterium]|nr:four helix bundle protein [Chitinophagaceae bacterium]